ncbi:SRPBCC family protein [Mangrovimonas spongiae]|uniref:SRPBCC family protein n=1 Tax=Mangrovimonas spongiae TaxID=2494697 RepID=A0A428K2W8_9FLAO|nr:SRPBCC family protein [Mangrovimonas spongiae]RSK40624.1 SRPBCC family protein [Mangrovimonas spongiae]
MNLESPKVTVKQTPEKVFEFLSNVKNFEKLMPENTKFEVLDSDSFLFALKGMPEIKLKKKETESPNKIVLGAAGGKIDFSLTGDISQINNEESDVKLTFNGDFNPMMAMMIKSPISNFIKTLAENIPNAI